MRVSYASWVLCVTFRKKPLHSINFPIYFLVPFTVQKRLFFFFSWKENTYFRHGAFQSTFDAFSVFKILPLELQIIHHCHCWN